ncbi:MAG: hypothetical protein IJR13_01390 [Bacteroidales bacterium]|nr:hypothetical protein [Bacteroidales bacterium]
MKKILMLAFAATALLCATSCTKDDDDSGDGNYPENLTGVWTPEDEAITAAIAVQAPDAAGVSEFEAKLPLMNLPVTEINSTVTYDATTGIGTVPEQTFELSSELLAMLQTTGNPVFVIEIKGIGANKINVKLRIKGEENTLFSKNFKRESRYPEYMDSVVIVPVNPGTDPEPQPEPGFIPPEDASGTYVYHDSLDFGVVKGTVRATVTLRQLPTAANQYFFLLVINDISEDLGNMFVKSGNQYAGLAEYDAENGTFTFDKDLAKQQYPEYAAGIDLIKTLNAKFTNTDKLHVSLVLDVTGNEEIMNQIPEQYRGYASNFPLFNNDFIRQR